VSPTTLTASRRSRQNYFRDYDPLIGRYLESDAIGNVDSPNTYLYAKADPILLSDAFGLTSDGDCCLRSQALGQNEHPDSAGWVICCEGRKVACAYTPGTPRKGWDILRACILRHGQSHLPEIPPDSHTFVLIGPTGKVEEVHQST